MRPSRRASATSTPSSRSDSRRARPPASARNSDGRISSSPHLITSPVPLDCIAAKAGRPANASGYRPVNSMFRACERCRHRPPRAVACAPIVLRARRPDPVLLELFDDAADQLGRYAVEAPIAAAEDIAGLLIAAEEQVAAGLHQLGNGMDFGEHVVEIHRLENEADQLGRAAVASLFA